MATTTVLLREDVESLGARGEIVKVKAGFARNYLLPRKLAVEATPGNVRQIEAERGALVKREARERATAEAQSSLMKDLRLSFERKVGEHGILYGSVTAMHIADALKEKGYEIDRRRVHLPEPIKETGDFTVPVRLHRDVTVDIPVTVAGEGGAQTAGAAQTAADAAATTPEEASGGEAAAEGEANAASAEAPQA
ncbi:MAG TPA: 50S ribosomal protein L9 [Pyrinomonadaceae bacterium]|jgi:large subunit ribosomal protein L9|nr:50S ribosomal protein L9 [Pyrinomonadaceae bacterium]